MQEVALASQRWRDSDKQIDQERTRVYVHVYVAPTVLMGSDVSTGRWKHAGWDSFIIQSGQVSAFT